MTAEPSAAAADTGGAARTGDAGPVITGEGVVKEYETGGETVRALRDVDFRIDPGEFVAIVGPSGSGKSTLLNVFGLLDAPTRGEVRLQGTDVSTFSGTERTRRRKEVVGFAFQTSTSSRR